MLIKQKIKQFLRPNLIKILATIFFVFISFYFSETQLSTECYFTPPSNSQNYQWQLPCATGGLDVFYYGFPLNSISKNCPGSCLHSSIVNWEIDHYFNFVFDIFFWYLGSCLMAFGHERLRTKK